MNKTLKRFLIAISLLVVILITFSIIYVNDYYHASDNVSDIIIEYEDRIEYSKNLISIKAIEKSDIGLIFYPGGKVEAIAYLPLLIAISDLGINVVLVEMPLNLAVLDVDAADDVLNKYKEIKSWYLAGHSLGGAMASSYMDKNYDKYKALILLGAYPINDANVNTTAIYGTYDIKLNLEKVELADNVYEIIDGNHAYFGDYGEQEGDGVSLITRENQQNKTVNIIKAIIFKE